MSSYNPYDQQQQQQQQQQQYQQYNHQQYHQQQQPQAYQYTQYQQQQQQPQPQQQPHYQPPPPPPAPNQLQTTYDPYYYQQQYSQPVNSVSSLVPHPTATTANPLPTHLPSVPPALSSPVASTQPTGGRYRIPSPSRPSEAYNPRHPSSQRSTLPHRQQPQHYHPYKPSSRPNPPPSPSQPPPFPTSRSRNAPTRYQTPRAPSRSPRNLPSTTPTAASVQPPPAPKQHPPKAPKNPVSEVVREVLSMFIHRELIMKTTVDQKSILESPESLTKEFQQFSTPAVFEEAKRKLSAKNPAHDLSAATQTSPEYVALLSSAKATHHIFHSALATARHSVLGADEAVTPNKRAIEVLGESWDSVKLAKLEAKGAKRISAIREVESNSEHAKNGGTDGTAGGGGSDNGSENGNVSRRARSPRRNCNSEPVSVLRKRIRELERQTDAEVKKEDSTLRENLAAAHEAVLRAESAAEAAREQSRVRAERLCDALENRDLARAERDDSRARFEAYRKSVEEYLPIEVKSKLAHDEREKEEESSSSSAEREGLKIEIGQVREILEQLKSEAANFAKLRDSMSRMAEIQAQEIQTLREQTRQENTLPSSSSSHDMLPSSTTTTTTTTESVEPSVKTESHVEETKKLKKEENFDEENFKDDSMVIVEEEDVQYAKDGEKIVSSEECSPCADGK